MWRPACTDGEEHRSPYQQGGSPHLFEAFYREEGSRNRSTGGSGLGLYLVKIILERHKAECTIENTEDGVRATVRFSD